MLVPSGAPLLGYYEYVELRIFPKLIKDQLLGKQWGILMENGSSRVRLDLDSSHNPVRYSPCILGQIMVST